MRNGLISLKTQRDEFRPDAPGKQSYRRNISIFSDLGFSVAEGPQIESDWYNFDSLNIPPDHPARQEFDTFYIDPVMRA